MAFYLLDDWNDTKRLPWYWDPLLPEVWVEHLLKWLPLSSKTFLLGSMLFGSSADQLPSWNRVSSGPCEPRPLGMVVGKGSCIVHECGSQSLKLKACCKVPEGSPGGDIGGYDGQVKGSVKKCLVGRLGYQTWLSGLS